MKRNKEGAIEEKQEGYEDEYEYEDEDEDEYMKISS